MLISLAQFTCNGTDIIQMIVRDNFLISAAQKGCFVWKMKSVTKSRDDQAQDCQLTFPGELRLLTPSRQSGSLS